MYQWLLVPKFIGVVLFAAGAGAACLARDYADRKRAVHRIASPGLLLTWLCGFAAAEVAHMPPSQLWIAGSIAASLVTQLALVYSVSRPDRNTVAALSTVAVTFAATITLMVLRPVR